jgi:hypothetical protein
MICLGSVFLETSLQEMVSLATVWPTAALLEFSSEAMVSLVSSSVATVLLVTS